MMAMVRPMASLRSANGPLMARQLVSGIAASTARTGLQLLTCGFTVGAGDENRTRTISLGS